ncbi:ferrous iron transport protein B [Patescibacteria group bacterium]|nr:ferrous iron transport protein B [Patescibacteria group bacterium]
MTIKTKKEKRLNIVLAGNANVGKSVIFNYLTGLHQHIGNWAGKTVKRAEGSLYYKGQTIDVLDLPGIYSLTTYSIEEVISREYIAVQKPDFVINVVDATNLERNLLFTLQLLELERPVILAVNMINLLTRKGIAIDIKKLEELLGIPVVPIEAIYGKGITEILDRGLKLIGSQLPVTNPQKLRYWKGVEQEVEKLTQSLKEIKTDYPSRWLAIKLLEKDKEVEKLIKDNNPEIIEEAKKLCLHLEKVHGHDSSIVIAAERCCLVSQIAQKVIKTTKLQLISLEDRLNSITCHKIFGYPVLIAILGFMFLTIFKFGNWSSSLLEGVFASWQKCYEGIFGISVFSSLGWSAVESIFALIQIALPYILPFYLLLYFLEDWGYLARVAYLTDNLMHKIGIHGKACIPLILGFGCNVPSCLSCRIMETERERFITGFLTTFVPCSAVTVIIMGLVGKFVGIAPAFGLYFLAILTIFVLGKLASKILPGEATELIMEMPDYKMPHFKTIILQTWFRLKEFIFIAAPLVVISGLFIELLRLADWLDAVAVILSPITVDWLGLPTITGVLLIFGILRKELILVMLATLLGTANFSQVLTPVQMITLALVSMFYVPCIATIAAFRQEFGWEKALAVTGFKILFAIGVGGIASRLLSFFIQI